MYRSEKFNPGLFGKLFHLGDKLSGANRWLKLGDALPWEKLDESYGRYFAEGAGRPAKDSRLVCGLLIVKLGKTLVPSRTLDEGKFTRAAKQPRRRQIDLRPTGALEASSLPRCEAAAVVPARST